MNSRQAFALALVLTGIIGVAFAALFLAAPAQQRNWIEVGEGYTVGVPGGLSLTVSRRN